MKRLSVPRTHAWVPPPQLSTSCGEPMTSGGCSTSSGGAQSDFLRRAKADYHRRQANDAFSEKNYRTAYEKYTEALSLLPDDKSRDVCDILAARCEAYLCAQRYAQACADAKNCCGKSPEWPKAWHLQARALSENGSALDAMDSYATAFRLLRERKEEPYDALIADARRAVGRLTLEQLAAALLRMLQQATTAGAIEAASVEEASPEAQQEGMYRHVMMWMRDKPTPGDYYGYLLRWLRQPWSRGMALLHRAAMGVRAKCFAQAVADADDALSFYSQGGLAPLRDDSLPVTHLFRPGTTQPFRSAAVSPLAWAWALKGQALSAEQGAPRRDREGAVVCFVSAMELDPENPEYRQLLADGSADIPDRVIMDALQSARHRLGKGAGWSQHRQRGLGSDASGGSVAGDDEGDAAASTTTAAPLRRLRATVVIDGVPLGRLTGGPRDRLRRSVAEAFAVELKHVAFSGIRKRKQEPGPGSSSGTAAEAVEVSFEFRTTSPIGGDHAGTSDTDTDWAGKVSATGIAGALGAGAAISAVLVEEAPDEPPPAPVRSSRRGPGPDGGAERPRDADRGALVPARPALEIQLPYKDYKMVRSDGRPMERIDKHPFQLSRVYYDGKEKGEQAWVEPSDRSCRWTQTSSELTVLVLKVPVGLKRSEVRVAIDLRSIKVESADGRTIYLSGELERAVVPEESVWTLEDAADADNGGCGMVLTLVKMNLELFANSAEHHVVWWPRLFRDHAEIAWDDDSKDYSDLPPAVMQEYLTYKARDEAVQMIEGRERDARDIAKEKDDARRRRRQERLHFLRTGEKVSWVELDRRNPAVDDMPAMPTTREMALLDAVAGASQAHRQTVLQTAIK